MLPVFLGTQVSNTAGLKFGSDPRRSFGSLLPGKRFPAPLLDDVNPYNSCGYSNVVLMCGINNLKSDSIKTLQFVSFKGITDSIYKPKGSCLCLPCFTYKTC